MAERKSQGPILGNAFLNISFPERKYLIGKGVLPEKSILVVGGISKAGKSIFVMNLGLSLAAGKPFLTFDVPKPIECLYLQAEINETNLQQRLRIMLNCEGHICQDDLKRFQVWNQKGLKLSGSGRGQGEIQKVLETFKPRVLIIDPMYKFHTFDENKSDLMRKFFDVLDLWVDQYGISIIIVHHFGKPQKDSGRSGAQLLRGSSVIFDYADSYISLSNNRKEDKRYVKAVFELRNEEDPMPLSLFRNSDSLWYEIVDTGEGLKVTAAEIIKALEQFREPITSTILLTEVMDKTGASERTIRTKIRELVDDHIVLEIAGQGRGAPKSYSLKNRI
jgi:hypothetical protein